MGGFFFGVPWFGEIHDSWYGTVEYRLGNELLAIEADCFCLVDGREMDMVVDGLVELNW